MDISELPCTSPRRGGGGGGLQNLSYGNEFDLHVNEPVGGTEFNVNSFARRLVLTQWRKATQKWLIGKIVGGVDYQNTNVHLDNSVSHSSAF